MRLGQNPAKFITAVARPEKVTAAVLTFIPFLSGYYAQSLDVLKVCLGSLRAHAGQPFDLMVFDNASCPDVVQYLQTLKDQGEIQYLILSEKNLGKVGAWNFIFGAAPGEYLAYSDSDVYFYPGWLPRHQEIFKAFPEAGTVAGLPRRGRRDHSMKTIQMMAQLPNTQFDEGKFIPDEWILDHARSLGKLDQVHEDLGEPDRRILRDGVSAYATATHFQFMVRTETVRRLLPLPYDRPMGDSVANFDRAIDRENLLRVAVAERAVKHLGNSLDPVVLAALPTYLQATLSQGAGSAPVSPGKPGRQPFTEWKPVKRILLGLYDRIFRLYFGRRV